MIRLYDTQSHAKRDFHPVEEGKIRMYVCGPTVYNYIHIGNARTFISFDVIRRYLMWRGFDVTFVQNVTDVDDKIIKKANEEGRSAAEVAAEYTEAFIADMHAADVLDPDIRPRATEEIDAMIDLVGRLIDAGHAYEVEGDVYFGVRSFPAYGALSNRNVDDLEGGHRELRADGQGLEGRKRDELDFAVWKAAKPGEPSWDSPWGKVRRDVLQLLDARRHAADQSGEDVQEPGQLPFAARRPENDRRARPAHAHAADALSQPARLQRRTPGRGGVFA